MMKWRFRPFFLMAVTLNPITGDKRGWRFPLDRTSNGDDSAGYAARVAPRARAHDSHRTPRRARQRRRDENPADADGAASSSARVRSCRMATGMRSSRWQGAGLPWARRSAVGSLRLAQLAARRLRASRRVRRARRHSSVLPSARVLLPPIAEGRSVVDIARQAGHSPAMTLDTYGHVLDELEATERRPAEAVIREAREAVAAGLDAPSMQNRRSGSRSPALIQPALGLTSLRSAKGTG